MGLRRIRTTAFYITRRVLSALLGRKVCPECGCLNMFGALYCISCGKALRLHWSEGVFSILTNDWRRKMFWRAYQVGGATLALEVFADLCNPV